MKLKIKLDLRNLSRLEKVELTKRSRDKVEANARYSTFIKAKFSTALAAAQSVETKDAAIKSKLDEIKSAYDDIEANVKTLDEALTIAGSAIEVNANDDATFFDDAGLEYYLAGAAAPITELLPPESFMVTRGDADGTVDFMCHSVHGAVTYVIQTMLYGLPIDNWGNEQVFLKSSGTYNKAESGQHIWLRIKVVGHNAESVWATQKCDIIVP